MANFTVNAIKEAISHLRDEEKETLASWLNASTMDSWDQQIVKDFSRGGRGAAILEQFENDVASLDLEPLASGFEKRHKSG